MIQQLMDRDLVAGVLSIVRQVISDLSIELDLAFIDELQDDRRRKLLRDRPDPKLRIRSIRDPPLHIRHPETLFVDDLTLIRNKHRSVQQPVLVVLLQ